MSPDEMGSTTPPTPSETPDGEPAQSGSEQRTVSRDEALDQLASELATGHIVSRRPGAEPSPVEVLQERAAILEDAYERFRRRSEEEHILSPAAEWLLDNFYIVQQALRQVEEDLPLSYYYELPKLDEGSLEDYPRIYALTREVVKHAGALIDTGELSDFVQAYQDHAVLTMGELWAIPTMLRVATLELLVETVAFAVDLPIPDMAGAPQPVRLDEDLSNDVIVAHCIRSLRALSDQDWEIFFEEVSRVDETLKEDPAGIYHRMEFKSRDQYRKVVETLALKSSRNEVEVARAAIDLAEAAARSLDSAMDSTEAPSATDVDVYSGNGGGPDSTSEAGREGGRISTRPARAPVEPVPGPAVEISRSRQDAGSVTVHVGFYLLGPGRSRLETAVGYRPTLGDRLERWIYDHAQALYLSAIALLTLFIAGLLVGYAALMGASALLLIPLALFMLLPASVVTVNGLHAVITQFVPPRLLPKLDFEDGIPEEAKTIVVIPALLSTPGEVDFLTQQLEQHYLSNMAGSEPHHLRFALLTDYADAPQQHMPEDEALLMLAQEKVEALNRRYRRGDFTSFYLFHRERRWNPRENTWMGWERKRGKLMEFNRLLLGEDDTSYTTQIGDIPALEGTRFVITLDADTVLARLAAHRLAGTLAHPLNQPRLHPDTHRPVGGYTILQPRTEIRPTSANATPFTRIFAGDTGLDLYTLAVSDVYQDLFGEGIFVGKGIYHLAAFQHSLEARSPENALLSHDLFEGIHARAGLVTDIVLYEDYPPDYLTHALRRHRWIRGDWQLLPWLFPRVPHAGPGSLPNPLSPLDRWKILDNLRRSLRAPALLALLVAGWVLLPGSLVVWTLTSLFVAAMPFLADTAVITVLTALTRLLRSLRRGAPSHLDASTSQPWQDLATRSLRWAFSLALLPYDAFLDLDAIVKTLWRLLVSRRHLLQWTAAAHTLRTLDREHRGHLTWQRMAWLPAFALLIALVLALARPAALPLAVPLLLVWALAPQIVVWTGTSRRPAETPLTHAQRNALRRLARRTWFYFERYVGPEDHWLPPDHFQEDPRGLVAHRTSPTNIGLMLLATLSAYDLGYIGPLVLTLRLRATFDSLDQLERYRGHFLNWIETHDLDPLTPRYVSTVDSGNLAATLLALKEGLRRLPQDPILHSQRWDGLRDILGVLTELLDTVERAPAPHVRQAIQALQTYLTGVRHHIRILRQTPQRLPAMLDTLSTQSKATFNQHLTTLLEAGSDVLHVDTLRGLRLWSERLYHHLDDMREEWSLLASWLPLLESPPAPLLQAPPHSPLGSAWQALNDTLAAPPPLYDAPVVYREARDLVEQISTLLPSSPNGETIDDARSWCTRLAHELDQSRQNARGLLIGLDTLADHAETLVQEMDFGFLYDARRQVFHIGYLVDAGILDANHYDLLASEARTASLVAIAKGDVPQSHWLHLARPLSEIEGVRALLSWSGSMFEYLMPDLLTRSYDGTLLAQTVRAIVRRQITYARAHGTPWGISESGYYRFDAAMNYQYRAFGVPGLGRKRDLGQDLVITPYASLLATSLAPHDVIANMETLTELGMLGHFGFYEAIDYTRARLPLGRDYAIVKSYMVHHQGMILAALTNALRDQVHVNRFHRDPHIRSVALLLQERIATDVPLEETRTPVTGAQPDSLGGNLETPGLSSWEVPAAGPTPYGHLLSNGDYTMIITSAGSGYSQWRDIALTRWRADTTQDDWGTWIYVQSLDTPTGMHNPQSLTYQPAGPAGSARFYPHQAEFRKPHGTGAGADLHDLAFRMEVTVAPSDPVEIRRIAITNHSTEPHHLRLVSYGEIVLAPQATDRRHPAFNKLFIESQYVPDQGALLFRRRPRSSDETPLFAAHAVAVEGETAPTATYETDRARFLGRRRTPRSPQALDDRQSLSSPDHPDAGTLDPIMSLSQEITLDPRATVTVVYLTIAGESRRAVLNLVDRYRNLSQVDQAFASARLQSEVELRDLELSSDVVKQIQWLLSALLYPSPALRARPEILAANKLGQAGLWTHTISGDYPILLLRLQQPEDLPLVREILRAHRYWRHRGLKIDVVLYNERDVGYEQRLYEQLQQLVYRTRNDAWLNARGGIFLINAAQLDAEARTLLLTTARVVLEGNAGSLAEQLDVLRRAPTRLPAFVPSPAGRRPVPPLLSVPRPPDLRFDNGYGGFTRDGRAYIIYLDPGATPQSAGTSTQSAGTSAQSAGTSAQSAGTSAQSAGTSAQSAGTPAPWINVIANETFGFLVSESGSATTWAENSGENRLTPWNNDPVSDTPGEALYLRDEETAEVWSPTPLPAGEATPYLIRHEPGMTTFTHHSNGLKQHLSLFVAMDAPVKIIRLRLENAWDQPRRITATYYATWVLGPDREVMQTTIVPEYDDETGALLARNTYNVEFGTRVAFLAADRRPHSLTADRTEFLGRGGDVRHPAALDWVGLAGTVHAGLDPCAALQVHVDLEPGESTDVVFLLGQGPDRDASLALIRRFQDAGEVAAAEAAVRAFWDDVVSTITVETPDETMNTILPWVLTQALACRIWGRSALYQSSGAYGFRDQLQDVMALLHARPDLTRTHILRAARHQFEAGDVLHWWHPPSGRGVRTRISDDLLWLPYVIAEYVEATGDTAILDEQIPFLKGEPLRPEEEERYGFYDTTAETATLYEHGLRALEAGTTAGPHGLPLIGAGDWNDGMNRVGIEGRGESVWLGWFLYATLTRFAVLCDQRGDTERAAVLREQAATLREALSDSAWDGSWYRRAYYDDGTPLGSVQNQECKIDAIAQSWAVLSGAGESGRMERAMHAVDEHLVREDDGLLLLFTPPFNETQRDPGYIKGYPPGIRENGGQYTHAAAWTVWAFTELGEGDHAAALFHLLNPINHSRTPEEAMRYQVEPYVVAADIYSVRPYIGQGGWTWYTGSSGWLYRLGVEGILGIHREGEALRVDPVIPRDWEGYAFTYRYGESVYRVRVENPDGVNRGVTEVEIDGEAARELIIPLVDDGKDHHVRVRMGGE